MGVAMIFCFWVGANFENKLSTIIVSSSLRIGWQLQVGYVECNKL